MVQCCLDSRHSEVRESFEFVQDDYASFTVETVLDVCGDDEVRAICESVIGKAVQKFGSHGILECMERCTGWV